MLAGRRGRLGAAGRPQRGGGAGAGTHQRGRGAALAAAVEGAHRGAAGARGRAARAAAGLAGPDRRPPQPGGAHRRALLAPGTARARGAPSWSSATRCGCASAEWRAPAARSCWCCPPWCRSPPKGAEAAPASGRSPVMAAGPPRAGSPVPRPSSTSTGCAPIAPARRPPGSTGPPTRARARCSSGGWWPSRSPRRWWCWTPVARRVRSRSTRPCAGRRSLCVHLARFGGVGVLLPGDRRVTQVASDLVAWPAVHARLAVVESGSGAPALGTSPRSGAIFWVTGADVSRSPAALNRAPAGARILVSPHPVPLAGRLLHRRRLLGPAGGPRLARAEDRRRGARRERRGAAPPRPRRRRPLRPSRLSPGPPSSATPSRSESRPSPPCSRSRWGTGRRWSPARRPCAWRPWSSS